MKTIKSILYSIYARLLWALVGIVVLVGIVACGVFVDRAGKNG